MIILGIETSCDETAAALVRDGRHIISSTVATQIEWHKKYSGVVPEIASRAHVITANRVVEETLRKAKSNLSKVDAIAVTIGPGLVGSLLVGKMTAESLGWVYKKPVLGVNHIEGHLLSPVLNEKELKPPFLGLVVSGGHTELIYCQKWGKYALLGSTRDDAAGEAFDKVAKMMGLGYPGGPVVDKMAKKGRAEKGPFPKPWLPKTWDFSFSGLKTAVLYRLREKKKWSLQEKRDLCVAFQTSVVDVLSVKAVAAALSLNLKRIVVGGGVAANSALREKMKNLCKQHSIALYMAPPELCTDNAAMIASSAFFKKSMKTYPQKKALQVQAQLRIPKFSKKIPPFSPALLSR